MNYHKIKCVPCNGSGDVLVLVPVKCSVCAGSGRNKNGGKCFTCNGNKVVPDIKSKNVKNVKERYIKY